MTILEMNGIIEYHLSIFTLFNQSRIKNASWFRYQQKEGNLQWLAAAGVTLAFPCVNTVPQLGKLKGLARTSR